MKFIFTVLLLTLLCRQRHRVMRVIWYVITAIDAVHTAGRNM